jgi:CHASE3 domain sensor protein
VSIRSKWWQRVRGPDWRVMLLMAVVACASAISLGYHRLLLAQRDWVEHTYQVMSTLESILQRMTDAETGQRGYILTSVRKYLVPYARAVEDLGVLSLQLRRSVRDSCIQLARVDELDQALKEKLDELARTSSVQEKEGSSAARQMVLSNVGQQRMDRVRSPIAQMRQTETELLKVRSLRALKTERKMLMITVLLAMLSISARLGVYCATRSGR